MSDIIYAIKVADLSYSGLKIIDVKIGKTTNINSTLAQYKRSSRGIEILDLWESNESLSLSECEKGIQQIAEKYAYEREGEKFIFLQESYQDFSENISLLLNKTTRDKLESIKIQKMTKRKIKKYTGRKPQFVKFQSNTFEVKTWREVLEVIAKQIYIETNDLSKALDIKGRKRVYFSKNCKDKNHGGELVQPQKIPDTPYCFESNISANQTMSIVNKLLNIFGYKDSDLVIGYVK
jgi:negative regulator of replication initiation